MKLWLLLAVALLVQEGVSTTALLVTAQQEHYSIILINIMWLALTVAQIVAGFYLGKWIQARARGARLERWAERMAQKLAKNIGKRGERVALVLGTFIISPFITALAASWLEISFGTALLYTLIGDALWYISEWITVTGLAQLILNVKTLF